VPRTKPIPSTPEDLELAFYEALESADLDALMALWADDEPVVCIHPAGPRLESFETVRDSWKEILSMGSLKIQMTPLQRLQGGLVAVHNVLQAVLMTDEQGQSHHVEVNATNVFHQGPKGWRMVMHHASLAIDSDEDDEDNNDEDDLLADFDPQPTLH
jgi:ketosteroid isomerase-like protein